jgi:phosphoglycolate phosphatase
MHAKKYSLLIFDWDGTLVDSEGLAIESMQKATEEVGYQMPPARLIRKYFGLRLEGIINQLFPDQDPTPIIQAFFKHFTEEKLATHFFEHAIETLNYLKNQGVTLAIATNRPKEKLNKALNAAKIAHLFKTTRCPEDGATKPDPSVLLTILEELGHSTYNTLMIGDSVFDLQCAQNAKIDAIAVCDDHSKKKELQAFKPVEFIKEIKELKRIFSKQNTYE